MKQHGECVEINTQHMTCVKSDVGWGEADVVTILEQWACVGGGSPSTTLITYR